MCRTAHLHPHRIYRPAEQIINSSNQKTKIISSHGFKLKLSQAELPHLVAYHDVGDFGLAVHILMFLLIGENREDKIAGFTLALPHQEAAGFAFVCEQLLCISPGEVPMVPPGEERPCYVVYQRYCRSTFLSFWGTR